MNIFPAEHKGGQTKASALGGGDEESLNPQLAFVVWRSP